jgi:hypothetical protein
VGGIVSNRWKISVREFNTIHERKIKHCVLGGRMTKNRRKEIK